MEGIFQFRLFILLLAAFSISSMILMIFKLNNLDKEKEDKKE